MRFGRYASRRSEAKFPRLWEGIVFSLCPSITGPSGLKMYGLSGRNHIATMGSASTPSDIVRSAGKYAFDTTVSANKGATVPNSPSLNITSGISGACWVYPRTVTGGGFQTFFAKRVGAANPTACNYQLFLNTSNGRLGYYNLTLYVSASGAPTINEWNHCGFSVTPGGALTLYLNGLPVHTATGVTRTANAGDLILASRPTLDLEQPNGLTDDYLLYDRALSGGEFRLLASRRGVIYEPRARTQFGPASKKRRRLLLTGQT